MIYLSANIPLKFERKLLVSEILGQNPDCISTSKVKPFAHYEFKTIRVLNASHCNFSNVHNLVWVFKQIYYSAFLTMLAEH